LKIKISLRQILRTKKLKTFKEITTKILSIIIRDFMENAKAHQKFVNSIPIYKQKFI
jgi:hypothetical protein